MCETLPCYCLLSPNLTHNQHAGLDPHPSIPADFPVRDIFEPATDIAIIL